MNVFPPLTGRLMYYASPSDQGGWWGAGRWGVSMSEAPWHWLYKWLHLHAFHFPAHRSREKLIGPSLIGDDWLQLGLPPHPDGLRVWQSAPPQTHTHTHIHTLSAYRRTQRWAAAFGCDHGSVLASADWCTVEEEKGANVRQLFWSVVTEWVKRLAWCWLEE